MATPTGVGRVVKNFNDEKEIKGILLRLVFGELKPEAVSRLLPRAGDFEITEELVEKHSVEFVGKTAIENLKELEKWPVYAVIVYWILSLRQKHAVRLLENLWFENDLYSVVV